MSTLCLTLAEKSMEVLREKLRYYAGRVPMIEVRLDYLSPVRLPESPDRSETELIATCRPAREGGRFAGSEKERIRILQSAVEAGFSWIDLEHDAGEMIEAGEGVRVIRSKHRFDPRPFRPAEEWTHLRSLPGDLFKLAVTPQNLNRLRELMTWAEQLRDPSPRVIIGMGDAGWPTRILAGRLGSAWTYVLEPGSPTVAPGQFSLDQASRCFRLDQEDADPGLIWITGSASWIWDLALRVNRLFDLLELNLLCVPARGIDQDGWEEYFENSALPFSGWITFHSADRNGNHRVQIRIGVLFDSGWKRETVGECDPSRMPDIRPLQESIEILIRQDLDPAILERIEEESK